MEENTDRNMGDSPEIIGRWRGVKYYFAYLPLLFVFGISYTYLPVEGMAAELSDMKPDKCETAKHDENDKSNNKSTAKYKEVKTLSLKQVFNTKSDWHVTAYHLEEDDNNSFVTSNLPAKICFWTDIAKKERDCIIAANDQETPYPDTLVKKLSIITIQSNKEPYKAIIFVKGDCSPTLGAIYDVTLWAYDHNNDKFQNILSNARLTIQGEYRVYPSLKNVNGGIFVTADRIWANGEKLDDPHKYVIKIFSLADTTNYKYLGKYVTRKKYNNFFDDNTKEVIGPELTNINKYIKKKKSKIKR